MRLTHDSAEQFIAAAYETFKKTGGCTITPCDLPPKARYVVAAQPPTCPSRRLPAHSLVANDLMDYMDDNSDFLVLAYQQGFQDRIGLGIWTDPETNEAVLDIVAVFEELAPALEIGKLYGEKFVYDLVEKCSIPVE